LTTQCHNPEDHSTINTNVLKVLCSYDVTHFIGAWLMCWPPELLCVTQLGNLLTTIFSMFHILLIHEISAAITLLNSMILLLTIHLSISPFQKGY